MKLFRPVQGLRNIDRRFTQSYGNNFKVGDRRMYGDIVKSWPSHQGLDYAGSTPGSIIPCYSVEDGIVIFAGRDNGFGNYVKVSGNSGVSYYCHLSKISVTQGSIIGANEEVGLIGSTGNSVGVHLHFGRKPADQSLRKFKDRGDPTPYISDWEEKKEDVEKERKVLADDGIFNGVLGSMDERMLTIVSRVYNKIKDTK